MPRRSRVPLFLGVLDENGRYRSKIARKSESTSDVPEVVKLAREKPPSRDDVREFLRQSFTVTELRLLNQFVRCYFQESSLEVYVYWVALRRIRAVDKKAGIKLDPSHVWFDEADIVRNLMYRFVDGAAVVSHYSTSKCVVLRAENPRRRSVFITRHNRRDLRIVRIETGGQFNRSRENRSAKIRSHYEADEARAAKGLISPR
jgi:hypothetical protein